MGASPVKWSCCTPFLRALKLTSSDSNSQEAKTRALIERHVWSYDSNKRQSAYVLLRS
jgi:hypothetical protein